MIFSLLLYISLAVFTFALIYKISTWFSRTIGISAKQIPTSERVSAAVKGILGT
ncbi:MAG: hypothetical protein JRC88_02750, partial [Deltaproteobacteria bacterium]|nr:hypothetical protein [Deltaproteobacteria bacterium]